MILSGVCSIYITWSRQISIGTSLYILIINMLIVDSAKLYSLTDNITIGIKKYKCSYK